MMSWLTNLAASGILKLFGDSIVQPFLNVWLKSKDVDLEKFKASELSTERLAIAVLDANVKFAQIKSTYALAVLQWWPFRLVLWLLLAICTARFSLIVIDSTWWWIVGCNVNGVHLVGDVCSWSIPPIRGTYGNVEVQVLLFFIVMKPVDTAITGAINLIGRHLGKK